MDGRTALRNITLAGLLSAVVVVSACGPGGASPRAAEDRSAGEAAEPTAGTGVDATPPGRALAGTATSIKVTVTGGPRAGTHSVSVPSEEAACWIGFPKRSGLAVNWPTAVDQEVSTAGFSGFSFIAENGKDGIRDSDDFFVQVRFGPFPATASTIVHEVAPRNQQVFGGRGTATVEVRGSSGLITLNAETKDGVKIVARVDCAVFVRL